MALQAFLVMTRPLQGSGAMRGLCLEYLLTIRLQLQFWGLEFFWRQRLRIRFDASLKPHDLP
jgi:hypothetical protein